MEYDYFCTELMSHSWAGAHSPSAFSTHLGFLSQTVQTLEVVEAQCELLLNQDRQVKNAFKG